jgi:hypothetical protein
MGGVCIRLHGNASRDIRYTRSKGLLFKFGLVSDDTLLPSESRPLPQKTFPRRRKRRTADGTTTTTCRWIEGEKRRLVAADRSTTYASPVQTDPSHVLQVPARTGEERLVHRTQPCIADMQYRKRLGQFCLCPTYGGPGRAPPQYATSSYQV